MVKPNALDVSDQIHSQIFREQTPHNYGYRQKTLQLGYRPHQTRVVQGSAMEQNYKIPLLTPRIIPVLNLPA